MRTLTVDRDADRLDRFLAGALGVSRSVAKHTIDHGRVERSGKRLVPHDPVRAGDVLEVLEPSARPPGPPPPEPTVLAEEPEFLVVEKPAGLLVHPAFGVPGPTLVDWLVARYPDIAALGGDRPGIVHRLDRDVSGVMVVARTAEAVEHFHLLFAGRQVGKRYRALVHGAPGKPEGTIAFRLAPSETHPGRVAARPANQPGREAITRYTVLAANPRYALLDLELVTGRTHQLRAHLKAFGHPIVGDQRYGSTDPLLPRPFLHAYELSFVDPNGTPRTYRSEIPPELVAVLKQLLPKAVAPSR